MSITFGLEGRNGKIALILTHKATIAKTASNWQIGQARRAAFDRDQSLGARLGQRIDQSNRVRVLGIFEELVDRGVLDYAASVHD